MSCLRVTGFARDSKLVLCAVATFSALVCCAVCVAPAAARSHRAAGPPPASDVVLRSSFRPIRAGVAGAFASGDYLLSDLQNGFYRPDAPVVINDRMGSTIALDPGARAMQSVLRGC